MKFFIIEPQYLYDYSYFDKFKKKNLSYEYKKFYILNRKKMTKVGNKFKNSNATVVNKFLSICTRDGKKKVVFKHFQKFFENYMFGFFFTKDENLNKMNYMNDIYDYDSGIDVDNKGINEDFFKSYSYFKLVKKLVTDESSFINVNNLINFILPLYNTLFVVKVKKLDKRMKAKYKKKYLYKLAYVYPKNRPNLTLKFMNFQSGHIKKYYLYERFMKTFLATIMSPETSLAWRKRRHAYESAMQKYKSN